ncbi:MAG: GGDEF domain-containing protein, partial [Pollutimonas bauzanensis]
LLPCTSTDGAVQLAERVRNHLATTPFRTLAGARIVTASFGVAQRMQDESLQDLFARADAMLYRAKSGGRNKVAVAG